jgi:hypothetical protein
MTPKHGFLLMILVVLCSGYALTYRTIVHAQTDVLPFDSPLPTPTPISPEAEMALRYVAAQHGIPQDQLAFGSQESLTFPLLGRTYTYVTVHYDAPDGFKLFAVLVDPATKTLEPDFNAVRTAEEAAYRAKYGKLDPTLYARLPQVAGEATLPVAVWAAHTEAARSQADIEAEIIARYPGAEESLAQNGVLWAVADPELALEIQRSYEQLLVETAAARVQPIMAWLKEQGFTAEEFPGMPALTARLPRHTIIALSERHDVAQIMLIEAEETSASDVAIPTDRAPQVWVRGYTGVGSRIAILERYNINAAADACLDIVATRASTPDPGHKSRVAAIAACNDPVLRGIAYGAQIVDAGHDGSQQDDVNALTWATNPTFGNRAHVVNHSGSFEDDNTLHFTDRAYDYWVKNRNFTAVIAAGNTSNNVTSPAKAYNVIAVGNVDDNNTVSWSDDVMRGTSSHVNPNTGVEKPEVAAPGTYINTVAGQDTGTSFAAPQVAGLAALLMQRDADLKNWPTAVKAIIMASAVHNVEGDRQLSAQDGAGSIDAALADWIAQSEDHTGTCGAPCWWNIVTTNTYPDSGGNVERTFTASRGERIRVAIAWLSHADPPTDTSLDLLYRNFDLQVLTPNGETIRSESAVNNFEIVDFTAPATGQYSIRVVRNQTGDRGNEPGGNLLGIAWSKQATYLPDVRQNIDGYSMITVRNDGAEPRQVRVTLFNGGYVDTPTTTLNPNQNWRVTLPANLGYGFAVVDGSEDLSVAVEQVGASQVSAYSGVQANPLGDPLWATTGGSLALPYVYRSYSGYTSSLRLLNTGAQAANVTLNYYDLNGFSAGQTTFNNQAALSAWTTQPTTGNGFYGSVAIQSSQPLAVLSDAYNTAIDISTQAGVGATSAYLPYIMRNYGGWNSCFVVRNLDNATNNVTITYYHSAGTTVESQSIAANAMWTRCQQSIGGMPDGPLSARIVSTSNRPFVLAINQSQVSAGKHMSYNGSQQGSRVVILPVLRRNHTENNRAWSSGFQVQNAGDANTCFAVSYFTPAGASIAGQSTGCLNPGYAQGFYLPNVTVNGMNDGLWSAVVTATQSIVVVANATCTSGCSGDNVYAYNGFGR